MLLSARMLKDVNGVNSFEIADAISYTKGDALTVYFQLINADLDLTVQRFNPPGRRYIPASGATLQAVIENINDAVQVTRFATQPYAGDGSIWALNIMATDLVQGTAQLRLTLNEGGTITRGVVKNAFRVQGNSNLCE